MTSISNENIQEYNHVMYIQYNIKFLYYPNYLNLVCVIKFKVEQNSIFSRNILISSGSYNNDSRYMPFYCSKFTQKYKRREKKRKDEEKED